MDDLGDVVLDPDRPVPMPDGVVLRADIYRPARSGRYPVLLQRTPYNKRFAQTVVYQHPAWYARQGYVVVVQDTRGRYASDGKFDPCHSEAADGAATIRWAAGLDDTTGKVGTYGFSYAGTNQLLAAAERPEGLACAVAACAGDDFFDGWTFRGGALQLAFLLSWTLEALAIADALRDGDMELAARRRRFARDLPDIYATPIPELKRSGLMPDYFFEWLEHDRRDDYWRAIAPAEVYDRIETPILHVGGWQDIFLAGTLRNFLALKSRHREPLHQRLLIGPWQHAPWARLNGTVDYGPAGDNRVDLAQIAWFNHWLKDKPLDSKTPAVSVFLLSADEWADAPDWPPPDFDSHEFYLHSDGRASSLSGSGMLTATPPGDEPPDIFVFDPGNPVPSIGGASCCRAATAPIGIFDQREVEIRNDVLVYTTDPLAEDLDVIGAVEAIVFAATDAVDTDWTAKLVDVEPGGFAGNVLDGIVRSRYAASLEEPRMIAPGAVSEFRIALGATAKRFAKGHRIRLELSSSNFPAYDININTGARSAEADPWTARLATQTIFHDRTRPSRLRLSVRRVPA
jgi:putative CocE/NonD family hydrolase